MKKAYDDLIIINLYNIYGIDNFLIKNHVILVISIQIGQAENKKEDENLLTNDRDLSEFCIQMSLIE